MVDDLILATMPLIPMYDVVDVLGIVYGSSTRTRGIGGRFVSGIQSMTGGKGTAYEEEIEKARRDALDELKQRARSMGANAVLSIDFETSEVLEGFILVSAYGTAVKLQKKMQ
ncbi:MAG: YbjQ family protein [Candidatus Bathyarchaeota archaeon]|nr:YbjQ family protein [Candidatus Bathyarchaeota archaeon]